MSSNETQAYTYTYAWCLSREPFRVSSLDAPGKPSTNTLNWQLKQKFNTECSSATRLFQHPSNLKIHLIKEIW